MIPARIGSKGIPQKVIRPFNGEPLIFKVINTALMLKDTLVVVNTDSSKISNMIKKKYIDEVDIYNRPPEFGGDEITLDELALDFVLNCNITDAILITLQPTSPLLSIETLLRLKNEFIDNDCDTLISVTEKRKLEWSKLDDDSFVKKYKERVNRQHIEPSFTETGAVVICNAKTLHAKRSRFGAIVNCIEVDEIESIDIDTYSDWVLAESLAVGRKLVFVTFANEKVGSGHLQRVLSLAHNFPDFSIDIVLYDTDEEWLQFVKSTNYRFYFFETKIEAFQKTINLSPTIVILDILSNEVTDIEFIRSKNNSKVVTFEDLGEGVNVTDLTINELYPSVCGRLNHVHNGPDYCFLRDEFLNLPHITSSNRQHDIVISFGGTDPNDLTMRVLKILEKLNSILKIRVILGIGAKRLKKAVTEHSLKSIHKIDDSEFSHEISKEWMNAKVGICGGGRTVYEFAVCDVKTFVLCQNSRELTHMYSSEINGIVNMGIHSEISDIEILDSISRVKNFSNIYNSNHKVNIKPEETNKRVVNLIRNLI